MKNTDLISLIILVILPVIILIVVIFPPKRFETNSVYLSELPKRGDIIRWKECKGFFLRIQDNRPGDGGIEGWCFGKIVEKSRIQE